MGLNFGLTQEQLEARRSAIGGSDAAKIVAGGEAWEALWLDKTGRKRPKAIMSQWDSALRHATEALQLEWYAHCTGHEVGRAGEIVSHPDFPIIRATLDGFDHSEQCVLQAKHVSEWTKNPIEWCIEHYSAQVQHEMLAAGTDRGKLLIMHGMKEPEVVNFTLDPFSAEVYISRCQEFWGYVERDEPPPGSTPIEARVPYEQMREVDFSGHNEFGSHAAIWLETQSAAKLFDKSAKELKALVSSDVKRARGYGIEIVRSKSGSLTIKGK